MRLSEADEHRRRGFKFYRGAAQKFDEAGPSPITVVSRASSGRTWEHPLNPRFDLADHSPDGFAWGYGGSGPAQASLALLADATGNDMVALRHYQRFKAAIIAPHPRTSELLIDADVICDMVVEWESTIGREAPGGVYSNDDAVGAAPGHMPIPGTDVEVVAYLQREDLVLLVNRGFCVYRALLRGLLAATPFQISTADTFVIRDVGELR